MLHIKNATYKNGKTISIEFVEYNGKYEIDMQDYINVKPLEVN